MTVVDDLIALAALIRERLDSVDENDPSIPGLEARRNAIKRQLKILGAEIPSDLFGARKSKTWDKVLKDKKKFNPKKPVTPSPPITPGQPILPHKPPRPER